MSAELPPPQPHAQLDWDDQGRPRSRVFDDVYFSTESGLDETRHVFLEQNRLRERFAALPPSGRFVIGETGFGTGLNFLCAWQLFEQQADPSARLHFVSVEKYPLTPADLQRAWPCGRSWGRWPSACCAPMSRCTRAFSVWCWTKAGSP